MKAKKSLGQNFLTSRGVAEKIVATARLMRGDMVLEVGPGKGFLTRVLLSAGARVIAVEKDERLFALLSETFAEDIEKGALTLVSGDIRTFDIAGAGLSAGGYAVVANIPYYITGEIIRLFTEHDAPPKKMVLLVQKEVAERITAQDGKESILSMSVRAFGTPAYKGKVPARYFSPVPKVDSAILLIDHISGARFPAPADKERFFTVMKAGFSHKRKTLANNLKSVFEDETADALAVCGVAPRARAEELSLAQWMCLANK